MITTLTPLRNLILASCFNARQSLKAEEIFISVPLKHRAVGLFSFARTVLDLEAEGYLKSEPPDEGQFFTKSAITKKGIQYVLSALLMGEIPEDALPDLPLAVVDTADAHPPMSVGNGGGDAPNGSSPLEDSCGHGEQGDPATEASVSAVFETPAGMNFAAPVANTSLVTDLHGGSEGELVGNADSLSKSMENGSGSATVGAGSPSIIEALFPEIYATAKRLEDVCECGELAHRTCPCGARTCWNHMYASDGSLADRNQMGFCRDCTEAIQEEQAGIERYGRA